MKLKKKFEKVDSLYIGTDFFYTQKNKLFSLKNDSVIIREVTEAIVMCQYEAIIFVYTDGKTYILKDNSYLLLDYESYRIINENLLLVFKFDYDKIMSINNIYNISENKLELEWTYDKLFFFNDFFFKINQTGLIEKLIKNDSEWSSLNVVGGSNKENEIKSLIGVFKNYFWYVTANNTFKSIDIISQKENAKIITISGNLFLSQLTFGVIFMDNFCQKIKILAYKYYIEIDLQDKKIEIKKEFEDGWSIGNGRFYEGDKYVYFCGTENGYTKKSIGNNTTGIFNTETCEIEWFYTLEDDEKFNFFVDVPQANDTYFGVRASENKLYLFERNE
jgi:hypothetical protein